MKYPIIILVGILSSQIFAQDIGIKFGINRTYWAGKNNSSYMKERSTYHFGVIGNYDINEKYTLSAEIDYIKKRFGHRDLYYNEVGEELGEFTGYDDYNYLSVPLLLRFWMNKSFSIIVGGSLAYLWSARFYSNSSEFKFDKDLSEELNKIDVGGIAGISLKYQLFGQNFINDIMYQISFNSHYKNAKWDFVHLEYFSLSLGYLIDVNEIF